MRTERKNLAMTNGFIAALLTIPVEAYIMIQIQVSLLRINLNPSVKTMQE
jgi:hypothetical protein